MHLGPLRHFFSGAVVMAVVLLTAVPGLAIDRVTVQVVAAGDVKAYLTEVSLTHLASDDGDAPVPGFMRLLVNDARGNTAGWQIALQATELYVQDTVSQASLTIIRAYPPYVVAGQPVNSTGPHNIPAPGASLAMCHRLIWAARGSGSGVYGQRIDVLVEIPDQSSIDSLMGTLLVTTGNAP